MNINNKYILSGILLIGLFIIGILLLNNKDNNTVLENNIINNTEIIEDNNDEIIFENNFKQKILDKINNNETLIKYDIFLIKEYIEINNDSELEDAYNNYIENNSINIQDFSFGNIVPIYDKNGNIIGNQMFIFIDINNIHTFEGNIDNNLFLFENNKSKIMDYNSFLSNYEITDAYKDEGLSKALGNNTIRYRIDLSIYNKDQSILSTIKNELIEISIKE